jgi:hypothetical protein
VCLFWNCSDSVVFLKLFRQCGIFRIVPTVWYFWNCSDSVVFLNNSKNTTLSEQFQKYHTVRAILKIPHCRNNSKNTTLSEQFQKYHTVGTISKIPQELFRECGIFIIVPTVWYFYNCSDSVVFLELL